jgi:hypothetical protein
MGHLFMTSLPLDIHSEIVKHAKQDREGMRTLTALSLTSRAVRETAIRELFHSKTLSVPLSHKQGAFVAALRDGDESALACGRHVKDLSVEISMTEYGEAPDRGERDVATVGLRRTSRQALIDGVAACIAVLSSMPNVQSIGINTADIILTSDQLQAVMNLQNVQKLTIYNCNAPVDVPPLVRPLSRPIVKTLSYLECSAFLLHHFEGAPLKYLGLTWDPAFDQLASKIKISDTFAPFSSLTVLSAGIPAARLIPFQRLFPQVKKLTLIVGEFWVKGKTDVDILKEFTEEYKNKPLSNVVHVYFCTDEGGVWEGMYEDGHIDIIQTHLVPAFPKLETFASSLGEYGEHVVWSRKGAKPRKRSEEEDADSDGEDEGEDIKWKIIETLDEGKIGNHPLFHSSSLSLVS